ncbi:sulfurtransferase [Rhizobium hainanense]|uniref:Thiosulfate/3-mercaptopyruvate sulfurtransferase n=1 Tax=Rhizobium hainanense TaxID=52131 RepID=A0A1C3WJY3_9HYPH|nr:rhodanese-like domain-containing protein [Rhizobium hainanense]SCB40269.1 thiosulfate/3-mercaptopyruvate sulfurtransferase [Rhizobium hainanense]
MSYDPVIELSALLTFDPFRLLDARAPVAFNANHPPSAVPVPIEAWELAARADETSFENVDYWEEAISALGIDGKAAVVVYDDGRMTEAARVWFILQYFGVKAFILNGGWPAIDGSDNWSGLALPFDGPAPFAARPGSGSVGLVDRQLLKAELGANIRVFDARTPAEFAGDDLRRNARGGHLPGARLLPHSILLASSRLKPARELRALLTTAGFQPGDHIVTHCDGGGRAALAAVAAARAGYDDVRAYYLSFADWAKDESCSIVKTD